MFAPVMTITLGLRIAFLALFYDLGVYPLALFEVASVAIYLLCVLLVHGPHRRLLLPLSCAEVLGHTLLATLLLGWDSGFHYHYLILAALIFATNLPIRACVFYAVGIGIIYAGTHVLALTLDLATPVPSYILWTLQYVNMMTMVTAIAMLSYLSRQNVQRSVRALERHAATDPLTGVANRREFSHLAEIELSAARSTGYSVLLADVDNFKRVNDAYGHDVGDQLLITVCARLRSALRAQDLIARWGGEEFIVLLPNIDERAAFAIAERARRRVGASPVPSDDRRIEVSITIGVYASPAGAPLAASLRHADSALRTGKRSGKNRVAVFDAARSAPG